MPHIFQNQDSKAEIGDKRVTRRYPLFGRCSDCSVTAIFYFCILRLASCHESECLTRHVPFRSDSPRDLTQSKHTPTSLPWKLSFTSRKATLTASVSICVQKEHLDGHLRSSGCFLTACNCAVIFAKWLFGSSVIRGKIL